jgi:(p)ppGpp synthase/HD superfamily hydrolase
MDGGIYDKTDRLLADATAFCILAHAGQHRKNVIKEPYCFHPMRVMMWLYRNGERQQEVLASALLHDVVEDTPHTLSEIREKFGDKVASIVAEVTTDKRLTKLQQKQAQVEKATSLSPEAAAVKIADRVDNLESYRDGLPADWTREYALGYLAHGFALARQIDHPLSETLRETVRAVSQDVLSVEWEDGKADGWLARFYEIIGEKK